MDQATQPQPQVEERLVANYIMARFMSGSIVGTAGTQWMVFADKLGAACDQCLHKFIKQWLHAPNCTLVFTNA